VTSNLRDNPLFWALGMGVLLVVFTAAIELGPEGLSGLVATLAVVSAAGTVVALGPDAAKNLGIQTGPKPAPTQKA
jgi:hypothetical protein